MSVLPGVEERGREIVDEVVVQGKALGNLLV